MEENTVFLSLRSRLAYSSLLYWKKTDESIFGFPRGTAGMTLKQINKHMHTMYIHPNR